MQAWEKYQTDLYLLATDILDNFSYQPEGYKSWFYYAFNGDLSLLQSKGTYSDQLKLLDRLVQRGALTYTTEQPSDDLPRDFFSKGALNAGKQHLVKIRIEPEKFNDVYEALRLYEPVGNSAIATSEVTVRLRKEGTNLLLAVDQTGEAKLLKVFRVGQALDELFSYLVNVAPNTRVTRATLELEHIVFANRRLDEVVNKVLGPIARQTFFAVREREALQLNISLVLRRELLDKIVKEADKL